MKKKHRFAKSKSAFIGIPIALMPFNYRILGERGEVIVKHYLEEHGWKVLHNTVPEEMSDIDFTEAKIVEKGEALPWSLYDLMDKIPMHKIDFILGDKEGKSYFADVKTKSSIRDLGWIDKGPYGDWYLKFAEFLPFIVFFYIDENRSLWRFDLKEPKGEWLIGRHYMVPKTEMEQLTLSKDMQRFIDEYILSQRQRWEPKLKSQGWSKYQIDRFF